MKNNFMIGFVSKYYRTLIEVSLWISLILCIGFGWSTGGDLIGAYKVNFIHRVLGIIFIGLPIFAAIMAMTGGFINILNMDENISAMRETIESIQEKLENEGTQASGEKKQTSSDNAENPLVL
jgi:hypothetical protein